MKFKNFLNNLSVMSHLKHYGRYQRLSIECVSVFLILLLLVTSTFAWFTTYDVSEVDSKTFTLEAGSGLRVNDGEDLSTHIILDSITLDEASSVDGRNFYLPISGTFGDSKLSNENITANMVFREGNAGDKNIKYWAADFLLKGDSETTEVYVKSYEIKVDDQVYNGSVEIEYDSNGFPVKQAEQEDCPVCISFIADSSEKPTVIDPTALISSYAKEYAPVYATDAIGNAITYQLSRDNGDITAFSDFYYGQNNPIFTLDATKPLPVTMVVWLEGTGDNWERYAGKEISVDIELESNWTDMERVWFVDDTVGDTDSSVTQWIYNSNDPCLIIMSYKDAKGVYKYGVMNEGQKITTGSDPAHVVSWYSYIPEDVVTDISFYRFDISDATIYNAWHTRVGVNSQVKNSTAQGWIRDLGNLEENRYLDDSHTSRSTTYTAKRGNGYSTTTNDSERLAPCIGYWKESSSGDGGGGNEGGDPDGDITINISINLDSSANWVYQNCTQYYTLYVVFDNGTSAPIGVAGYNYFRQEGIKVKSTAKIVRFEMRSPWETHDTTFNVTISDLHNDYWYNFKMHDGNQITLN